MLFLHFFFFVLKGSPRFSVYSWRILEACARIIEFLPVSVGYLSLKIHTEIRGKAEEIAEGNPGSRSMKSDEIHANSRFGDRFGIVWWVSMCV